MFKIIYGPIILVLPLILKYFGNPLTFNVTVLIDVIAIYSIISGIETILSRNIEIKIAELNCDYLSNMFEDIRKISDKLNRIHNETEDYYHQLEMLLIDDDEDDFSTTTSN